jgi:hypothetical protein
VKVVTRNLFHTKLLQYYRYNLYPCVYDKGVERTSEHFLRAGRLCLSRCYELVLTEELPQVFESAWIAGTAALTKSADLGHFTLEVVKTARSKPLRYRVKEPGPL